MPADLKTIAFASSPSVFCLRVTSGKAGGFKKTVDRPRLKRILVHQLVVVHGSIS
jgi:hypothetical protein